eukprot:3938714-Rhodomonas_salina.1
MEPVIQPQAPCITPHQQLHGKHVMISARFDGAEKERKARELNQKLRKNGITTFMVEVGHGETFGVMTDLGLFDMWLMVAVCFDDYGQKTESKYSSYWELKYANDNNVPILPIQLCETFPPAPKDVDGRNLGAAQNKRIFTPDLVRLDWHAKPWNAEVLAREVANAILKQKQRIEVTFAFAFPLTPT